MINNEHLKYLDRQPLFKEVLKKWALDILIHQNTELFESLEVTKQEQIKKNHLRFDHYVGEHNILINPGANYFTEIKEFIRLLA